MKKSMIFVGLFLITIFLSLFSVSAAFASEQAAVNAGYQCLYNQIVNKTSLGFEEAVFTSLAIGFNNASNNTFNSKKNGAENCWQTGTCTLKETAQVGIVYDFWGRNTTGIQDWIVSRNISPTEIQWFLEVDIENQLSSTCTIREDVDGSSVNTIYIADDQKLSGNTGSCFSLARSDYLLQFNNNCMDKKFVISCNEAFLTATIYKKSNSETYYVNSDSHSASPDGTTEESVSARCLRGQGEGCDYEGTLWGALALQQFGMDVTPFMPYLIALSDDDNNDKYFPSALLYMITESDDSYSELTQLQTQSQGKSWWSIQPNGSRIYDTSLAILALQGSSAQELTRAKSYLLSVQQSTDTKSINYGCWNSGNIRDTAFVLHAGWPQNGLPNFNGGTSTSTGRTPPIYLGNATTNSTGKSACELGGYSCTSAFSCLDSGGTLKSGYSCTGRLECCTVKPASQASCSSQEGTLCASSQRCTGRSVSASDGSCCFGTCVNVESEEDQNACETEGYGTCQASCESNEYDGGYACSTPGFSCCIASKETKESGSAWVWILLLLILTVLIIIAIMYRDKIKLWWFKMQNKKQPPRPDAGASQPMTPRRPPQFGGFNSNPRPMVAQRPIPRQMQPGIKPKVANPKDKEMEDTLKKLKEMSE